VWERQVVRVAASSLWKTNEGKRKRRFLEASKLLLQQQQQQQWQLLPPLPLLGFKGRFDGRKREFVEVHILAIQASGDGKLQMVVPCRGFFFYCHHFYMFLEGLLHHID